MDAKILNIVDLIDWAGAERSAGRKVVQCHGVFDLLHIGHIRYLQQARGLGDVLVVTVTPDRFVNKGPHRPAFPEAQRAAAIAALDCVDYVAVNDAPTARDTILRVRPDVFAKGAEFATAKTPELIAEEEAATSVGTEVAFIEDVTSSSSHLINNYMSVFTPEVEDYLRECRESMSAASVLECLDRGQNRRVLVVGEGVLEEVVECQAVSQSPRAPIVAARYESQRRYAGGALGIANHLAALCGEVTLVAMLGDGDSSEDWIRQHLNPRVTAHFLYKENAPTIIKRRYRESYYGVPLFEMDVLDDRPLGRDENLRLEKLLSGAPTFDAVFVADYGHGMLGPEPIRRLGEQARFLAVTTPVSAANRGFHTISKYARCDYVSLAEQELRLDRRSVDGDIPVMLRELRDAVRASTAVVTLGKRGCLSYNSDGRYHNSPALAVNVVDRFGAGDAFFSVSALCALVSAPAEVLGFLGNVAGAEACATVGNVPFLDRLSLGRHVESLFK